MAVAPTTIVARFSAMRPAAELVTDGAVARWLKASSGMVSQRSFWPQVEAATFGSPGKRAMKIRRRTGLLAHSCDNAETRVNKRENEMKERGLKLPPALARGRQSRPQRTNAL